MTNEWHAEMDYETYTEYLTDLCKQLDMRVEWPVCERRFEEPALRKIREESFMKTAKKVMADRLRAMEQNFLLVLDDVTHPQQLELFRFNESQSMIATATDPTLKGLDWNVRLDVLGADETMEIFLNELALPPDHIIGCTKEVRMLPHYCDYHPLTVRTLGRWCRLKSISAGLKVAIQEVYNEMGPLAKHAWERIEARALKQQEKEAQRAKTLECSDDSSSEDEEDDPSTLLFDILSLMMGPDRQDGEGTTVLFVLCFAAMVVVFPERVPLDVALLLWERILTVEPLAQQELSSYGDSNIKRRAWHVAEGLFHMGVVSIVDDMDGQPWIESYHEAYTDFAIAMAKGLDLGDDFEEVCENWHKAFVTIYFTQRINSATDSNEDSNSWEYAVKKLPDHIFRANMLSMAETILADDNFFQARLDAMGWPRAIRTHINDCVQLQQRLEENLEDSLAELTLSPVFTRTATMVSSFAGKKEAKKSAETVIQVSRALYDIGVALAEHGYFEDAMIQFEAAQSFSPESQSLRTSILYGTSWVLTAGGNVAEGLQKLHACQAIMEKLGHSHPLYKEVLQLSADALIEKCDYAAALVTMVKVEEELLKDSENNLIELGTLYKKKGRLLHTIGKLGEAIVALETSIYWKKQAGEFSHGLANTYSSLGDVQMETTQPTEARKHYEAALSVLREINSSTSHIIFTLTSGKLRYLNGENTASFGFLSQARLAINKSPLLVMDQSAYDLRCIARMYRSRGNVDVAADILEECLLLTSHRPGSLERALALMHLGRCFIDMGKNSDAIKHLQMSLDIQMSAAPESLKIIETTMKLGKAYFLSGVHDKALEKYENANSQILRVSPEDAEGLAEILYSKGEVYEATGDRKNALQNYDECIAMLQRQKMRDHLGIAKAKQAIGRMAFYGSHSREAIPYFQEAIRIQRVQSDGVGLAEAQHALGVIAIQVGENTMAEENLLSALALRRRLLKTNLRIAETLLALGDNYVVQNKNEKALEMYEECVDLLDDSSPLKAAVHFSLGKLYVVLEKLDEALSFFQKALDSRTALLGKKDTQVGRACLCIGMVHFLSGETEKAGDKLSDFVIICEGAKKKRKRTSDFDLTQMTAHLMVTHVALGDILYTLSPKDAVSMWETASGFSNGSSDDVDTAIGDMISRRKKLSKCGEKSILLEKNERETIKKALFTNIEPNY